MTATDSLTADRHLDITDQVCPMTFVRTKLVLEAMSPGELLEVRLGDGEPLENVPRSAAEMGHEVLSKTPDGTRGDRAVYKLLIRVGALRSG